MSRTQCLLVVTSILVVGLLAGCGGGEQEKAGKEHDAGIIQYGKVGRGAGSASADEQIPAGAIERKIIYNATLTVQVENFSAVQDQIEKLVEEFHGTLERADIKGSRGQSRSGSWKVRIAPTELTAFRNAVMKLGEVLENTLASQDVTEEYYDLAERIKSKEREVEKWRSFYDKAASTQDAINVTKELDRAQEELDRFKGRQKVLQNLSNLTTVDVKLQERGVYVPEESPSFGVRIGRVLSGSFKALLDVGQFLVLCVVGVAPWLPVALGVALPSYYWWRRRRQ